MSSSSKIAAQFRELASERSFQFGVLVFAAISLLFAKLSGFGLMSYDDAYYAEKAKEMFLRGSWMTVYYNNLPSFDNPPFFFWLEGLGYRLFGITEYGAIFPSSLAGLCSIILIFFVVCKVWDQRRAFFTCFVLLTTPHFVKFSRHSMLDIVMLFLTCTALFSFYFAPLRGRWLYLLWGLAVGCCILNKSVLGTLSLPVAFTYLMVTRQFKELLRPTLWLGLLVGLGVGSIWYLSEYMLHGQDFINGHFHKLLFAKATESAIGADLAQHLTYFLFPFRFDPHWSLFMVGGFVLVFRQALARDRFSILVVCWYVVYVVLLSLPLTKKSWYLTPALPAMAMMAATAIEYLIQRFAQNVDQFFTKFVRAVAILALGFNLLALATPLSLSLNREVDMREFSSDVHILGESKFNLYGYKIDFYSVNNASLFYSDYAFDKIEQDASAFIERFRSDTSAKAALIPKEELASLKDLNFKVLREGEDYLLISDRDVDFSKVSFLRSRVLR